MSLPQTWNLGCYSQWLAAGGIPNPSFFIWRQDKLCGMIYTPELPIRSGWGWDVLDFFLFLVCFSHSFTAFSWGHLHNKSLPLTPLALGWLPWKPDLDRWPNVSTCHSHRQNLCYRPGRSRQLSQQAWKQTWSLHQGGILKWGTFRERWEDQGLRRAIWTVPPNSDWNRWPLALHIFEVHLPFLDPSFFPAGPGSASTCLGHWCEVLCPHLPRHHSCLYLGPLQGPHFGDIGQEGGLLAVPRCLMLKSSSLPQGLYFLILALRVN